MLMFATLAAAAAAVSALPYSGYSNLGYSKVLSGAVPAYSTGLVGGYSGLATTGLATTGLGYSGLGLGLSRGYSTGFAGGLAGYGGYSYGQTAVAPLAVQSNHQVSFADVPSGGNINPIAVDIDANRIPINMVFRSASSQLNVQQAHEGAAGSVQESASEDEPHVLKHSVTKPVLQDVREVITPFRRITQEVQPVREEINTIVARGTNVNRGVIAAPIATGAVYGAGLGLGATYGAGYTRGLGVRAVAAPVVSTVGYGAGYGAGYGLGSTYGLRSGLIAPVATTGYTTGFATPSLLSKKIY